MARVATYTKSGAKATTPAKLDKAVFGLEVKNHELLKSAYVAHLANSRENLAVTKTRGLVRGGGKKPWRQKGTGRARFGSSRNPIWRGGGIVFGPTGQENYSKSVNKKAKRLSLRQALSLAASDDKMIIIEDIKATKTAELAKLLSKIGAEKNILLVVEIKTEELDHASRNLANVKLAAANYLSVPAVLDADKVVITKAGLEKISSWLAYSSEAANSRGEVK